MTDDDYNADTFLTDKQCSYEIDEDIFLLIFRDRQRFQKVLIFLLKRFDLRAYIAAYYIFLNNFVY